MLKTTKLKKMSGATVRFIVDTPTGQEKTQEVYLRVDRVFKANNGEFYVAGIALKRIEAISQADKAIRQYKISNIHNRSISIIADNKWTKKQKSLQRLVGSKV